MDTSEKVNMEINIGGQIVNLTVPFQRQDFVRDTEREIDIIFSDLRRRFPRKDERALLAMVIYQYASNYFDLRSKYERALSLASDCERKI
ncbi:MAG: cell division protein ZapA, partial [Muribaculaceae bacterium]|nr:cell division protein ZapA [Muribaculaceae bacterium]